MLLEMNPQEFVEFLKENNIKRFYFVYDKETKKVRPSHPALQEIADFISTDKRDFNEHEGAFFQISSKYDILQGAFVHRTNRGQAAGGVRFWEYNTMEDYLRDGLRLAKGMTRKNALAGLWWGGGKGVMAHNPKFDKEDSRLREAVYKDYGRLMTSIRGCYVTAEDVGTSVEDMANIFSQTRFTTCIPNSVGGSGNPSAPTAMGVVSGMEAALHFLGMGALEGKTIVVQGMGHVAEPLIGFLFERKAKKIIAADINSSLIEEVKQKYAGQNLEAHLVSMDDHSILFEECDIVSPCATGAILNPQTIPQIKANIICGAANNQLEDSARDGKALMEKGTVYVPDFLTNRMGIVNCADEQSGYVDDDPFFKRHLDREWEHSIFRTTLQVLAESHKNNEPPADVAIRLADKLSLQDNPIYGHRGEKIIRSLVNSRWQE